MSCQPDPETSHQVYREQLNKQYESVYQQLKIQEKRSQYMTIDRPNCVKDSSQVRGQSNEQDAYQQLKIQEKRSQYNYDNRSP